ncbi:hypothetical protein BGX34_000999 [Mortierella sp. NVP85]|nr:hypothetical protein BGX34_000999 [Mortierella sp. NVP85]
MGAVSSTYRSYFDPETEVRIVMVGNNNAGKTTIMYQLKVGLFVNTIPTTGFILETIHYKNFALSIWEIGIRNNTAFLWRRYAEQAVGVIFVVDSYDVDRIGEANEDLRRTLNELDGLGLPKIPLLVYANKQESRTAMSVADVRDQLDLKSLQDREWHIQGSSATMNDGLWEGLDWLLAQIKEDMKKNAGLPTNSLLIGLDAAGKTTILYSLKFEGCGITTPTIGFNVEVITHNDFNLTIWDVCGQGRMRRLWRHYFQDIIGLMFVVDSNDTSRMSDAKEELWRVLRELSEAGLPEIPLLVYANKQDLATSMTVAEVRDTLDMKSIQGREWHIQGSNALMGDGLIEGLEWYIAQVQDNMKRKVNTAAK